MPPTNVKAAKGGGGGSATGGAGASGGIHIELVTPYIKSEVKAMQAELALELEKSLAPYKEKLSSVPTTATIWKGVFSILGGLFVLFTAFLAVLALGGDRFDGGMAAGGGFENALQESRIRAEQQDRKIAVLEQRLAVKEAAKTAK